MDETHNAARISNGMARSPKAWRDFSDFLDSMKSGSVRAILSDKTLMKWKTFQSEIAVT
jgi:hypothetical protein